MYGLENVDKIKYLGVTITNDLRWNTHVGNICIKANRTLGFLRLNFPSCPRDIKEMAYKGLVRPVLEYAKLYSGNLLNKGGKVVDSYCFTKV